MRPEWRGPATSDSTLPSDSARSGTVRSEGLWRRAATIFSSSSITRRASTSAARSVISPPSRARRSATISPRGAVLAHRTSGSGPEFDSTRGRAALSTEPEARSEPVIVPWGNPVNASDDGALDPWGRGAGGLEGAASPRSGRMTARSLWYTPASPRRFTTGPHLRRTARLAVVEPRRGSAVATRKGGTRDDEQRV